MLMVDRLVSVTAYGHGGGGHAGHSSRGGYHSSRSGYHSSRGGYHLSSWGGGGGSDDDDDRGFWWWLVTVLFWAFVLLVIIHWCHWCTRERVQTAYAAYAGYPYHGYLVAPRIPPCQPPQLTTPCAGPDKTHHYQCGNHVALLVNGTYVRAVFSRVDEDFFPPRAEFSFVTEGPVRTCEHQRLLEVEAGGTSGTCLLSAQDMLDGQYCQVAPVEFVGFAPATLRDVMQNTRTRVSPAPVIA